MSASSETSSSASSARSILTIGLKIAVSVGLLWLLFSRIDTARLWASARQASVPWLLVALAIYAANVLTSVWRWRLLLRAQQVNMTVRMLLESFLVSLFFNNFLPSNIGGDVIRIRDSGRSAGSKTLATTVVLVDRIIGLMGLMLVAAFGATMSAGGMDQWSRLWASWLWAGFVLGIAVTTPVVMAPNGLARLLRPLTAFHPEWVGTRLSKLTQVLARFREKPSILARCFGGAVVVQASIVVFYFFVADALRIHVTLWEMAVIVPISFIIQMAPVSVNGFGVREATFSFYFMRIGQPIEAGILLSLVSTALIMLFSLSGAAVYVARRH